MSNFSKPARLLQTSAALTSLLSTIATSFIASSDPLERYLTAAELHLSNTDVLTLPQVIENIRSSVEKSVSQKAEVLVIPKSGQLEAGDSAGFAAIAIWFTPANPRGPRALTPESTRPFREYDEQSRDIKARTLQGQSRYYYLHLICRSANDSTPGAVSSLMRWGIEKATEENVPVYIEATNAHAVKVYEHFGFEVCGEITVGVGEVDEEGMWKEGGKGVKCWCMVLAPAVKG